MEVLVFVFVLSAKSFIHQTAALRQVVPERNMALWFNQIELD